MTKPSDTILELGKRAAACWGWKWMRGTQVIVPIRNVLAQQRLYRIGNGNWVITDGDIPDLSDPATLGNLLSLVRAAFNSPTLSCAYERVTDTDRPGHFWIVKNGEKRIAAAETEFEVLVLALEAAAL